ncbi:uncharacterized protein LOC110245136 [Exaiptasia diaphana]|uniref:Fibronectin type-III domain-containing protein n=1 Tax=Exaiptasia diaphana TaxID=2652724 RepID=A0A913YRC6_EXADI|nr:uncharacterized protein LOC110245136 [Exaiptasia diaphana]
MLRVERPRPPSSPILEIAESSPTTVTLSWSKPEENGGEIQYYIIYKKLAGTDEWSQIATLYSGVPLTFTVKDLLAGKTYSFDVTVKNKYGSSLMGVNVKTVTLPVETTTPYTTTSAISYIKVGVFAAFLALVVLLNILLVVFILSKLRTNKPNNDKKEDAAYYNVNAFGMESLPSTLNKSAGTRHPNQEHYQQLNPNTLQSRVDATPTYETVLGIATGERNDQHTYQALRNHPSVYQSLQTYVNVNTA